MVALANTSSYAYSAALAISADGSAVVGYATTSAFGPTGLLGPGLANGVSGDGSVIVGLTPGISDNQIFRWTQATGMVTLGNGYANAVSEDGSTIVGFERLTVDSGSAFRWTASGGLQSLGPSNSEAYAVSGDGSVIVGRFDQRAFIWGSTNGTGYLQDVLTADGLNLTGWQLTEATGISADGLTITGNGIDPSGEPEAWVARLDAPVPEPSALVIWLCAGIFGLATRAVRILSAWRGALDFFRVG